MKHLPHYIRPNEQSRFPRCHIVIDTEASSVVEGNTETQRWVLGCGAHHHQNAKQYARKPAELADFATPQELWEWVDASTSRGARSILVAHQLAYDLRISQAFTILPTLGWTLRAINLDAQSTWAIWRREDRTLAMVDSLSWLPAGLDRIGALVGIPKPPLPDRDVPSEALWARCRADVAILSAAWLELIDWLEAEDMGNWHLTGSGQAWAAWRHKWYSHRVIVHADDEIRTVERTAAWTGRVEAWRHGRQTGGPWFEWDFAHAYASIVRDELIPVRGGGHQSRPTLQTLTKRPPGRQVLVRAEVCTDVPVVPAQGPDGMWWPVGRFETTCWDVELDLVLEHGGTVAPLEAWHYDGRPALADWGAWVCAALDRDGVDLDPVPYLAVKHWSRALIGRTGVRHAQWRPWGSAPTDDVQLYQAGGDTLPGISRLLQLGRLMYADAGTVEAGDSTPMIMSRVMAAARVRLWRAMLAAGLDHVLYVDTDSLIVDTWGHALLSAARIPDLLLKAEWRRVRILGPRQLELDGGPRVAGLPRRAVKLRNDRWQAQFWTGLADSLATGRAGQVDIVTRDVQLRGTDHRRRHLPGGLTAPFRVGGEASQEAV